MIVPVGIAGDEISVPVAVIFVALKLMCGVRRAAAVDDDLPALQPLHALIDAARPFDCRLRGESQGAVVCDALRLCTVAGGLNIVVAVGGNPLGGLLVGLVVGVELVEQVDRFMGMVIGQADEREGIREPAPVRALVDIGERPELLVRDGAEFKILEDVPARPDGEAEILVLVAAGIALLLFDAPRKG